MINRSHSFCLRHWREIVSFRFRFLIIVITYPDHISNIIHLPLYVYRWWKQRGGSDWLLYKKNSQYTNFNPSSFSFYFSIVRLNEILSLSSNTYFPWFGYPNLRSRELSKAGGMKGNTTAETRHDMVMARVVREITTACWERRAEK